MSGADLAQGCVFCDALAEGRESPLVVYRGKISYILLNLYPYNNGHLMIVPTRHVASLGETSVDERAELMELTRLAELVLGEAYRPHGMNVGINMGRAGGAGIVDHVHVHVVPRWEGGTNFMTSVGESRVLPESLEQTVERLKPVFARLAGGNLKAGAS